MNSGKIIIGALAGLAAGALIGIFFAPDKGSDSRNNIVKKGEDYLDFVKNKFNSLLDSISGKFNGGKVQISEIDDNGRTSSNKAKREMQASAG
jgi:gas vesicle protein